MSAIIAAASVVLGRGPATQDLFIVRRADTLRFFGGFHAFPGGKVASEDAELTIIADGTSVSDPRRVCATRELFEETGVLLARQSNGNFPRGAWDEARRDLLADKITFAHLLERLGLTLFSKDLQPVGALVTPPFSPLRFDTSFFTAQLPEGQEAIVWPGELSEGRFASSAALLAQWEHGECLLTPPTVTLLESIRGHSITALEERFGPLLQQLAAGALPPIAFSPGVFLIPLKTVALPPAQYTNAFLVGREHRWLIDPGAHEPEEQQRLLDTLEVLLAQGGELRGIILTHQHPDHVLGVDAVLARHRVPVLAHPETERLLQGRIRIDRYLYDGDRLELGTAPSGRRGWHLVTLHTPGHAAGHLAFYDPHYRLLLAADLVSPLTSIVLAPPDGDLTEYLASLRRIRSLDCRMLLPSHGSATLKPVELIDEALANRARREEQLLQALGEKPHSVNELVEHLYNGLAEKLKILAKMQIEAGLEKLRQEQRAAPNDDEKPLWRLIEHCLTAGNQ